MGWCSGIDGTPVARRGAGRAVIVAAMLSERKGGGQGFSPHRGVCN
jgi:hypothetical protein